MSFLNIPSGYKGLQIIHDTHIPFNSYGFLPQLYWFDGEACVPTSITNAIFGLATAYKKPQLLGDNKLYSPSSAEAHAQLLKTRAKVAKLVGTTNNGTYFNQMPNVNKLFEDAGLGDQFSAINHSTNLSNLVSALKKGPVVFDDLYDTGGGHALLGIGLLIDDINANGFLEKGEGIAWIIDPLNPAQNYTPSTIGPRPLTSGKATPPGPETFNSNWNNTVRGIDGASIKSVEIFQTKEGKFAFDYVQDYVTNTAGGNPTVSGSYNADGRLYEFMSIAKSSYSYNVEEKIGKGWQSAGNAQQDCLFDFSDFIIDDSNKVNADLLIYFNEESNLNNHISFYQVADHIGSIIDPITGQTVSPGMERYIELASLLARDFSTASDLLSKNKLSDRESADKAFMGEYSFELSAIDGNAIIAPLVTTSSGDVWSAFSTANKDKKDHFVQNGDMAFGVEDLFGLGDRDFNDLHIMKSIISINGIS